MNEFWVFTDRMPPLVQASLMLAALLVALLWLGLPFAVFVIKRKLERIRVEQWETNRLLERLIERDEPEDVAQDKPAQPLTIDYE